MTAAETALRAARASSVLDGGTLHLDENSVDDPVFAGALRVAQALEGGATTMVGVWQRAPLQALARLHSLAAADLVAADALGRPRLNPQTSARLDLLSRMVTGGSAVPAPILTAVAHGEMLALSAFGSADGVVARGVGRLVSIATGLDPHGLGVPEVFWMRRSADYREAAQGFASGSEAGLTRWLVFTCRALQEGAREAVAIADSKGQAAGRTE